MFTVLEFSVMPWAQGSLPMIVLDLVDIVFEPGENRMVSQQIDFCVELLFLLFEDEMNAAGDAIVFFENRLS